MAASTISRDAWTNDTGSAASPNGDGTVLQNSVLQNHIYARVDEMFSGAGSYATLTLGGLLTAEGFGTHTFSAGGTGTHQFHIRNTSAGTANLAAYTLGNDATVQAALLLATSTSYTAVGDVTQDGALLRGERSGGLSLTASHASGVIRFYAGGVVEWLRLHTTGGLSLGNTTDPGAGILNLNKALHLTGTTAPSGVSGAGILYHDTSTGMTMLSNDAGTFKNLVLTPDMCGVFNSAAQSIVGDDTYRALLFDSEDFDNNTLHSTSSNTSRITIQESGVYQFIGHSGTLPTNSACRLAFRANGDNNLVQGDVEQGDNSDRMMTSCLWSVVAGDYIELVARHASVTGNWGSATRALTSSAWAVRVG